GRYWDRTSGPCRVKRGGRSIPIKHMRAGILIATGSWYHVMSLDILISRNATSAVSQNCPSGRSCHSWVSGPRLLGCFLAALLASNPLCELLKRDFQPTRHARTSSSISRQKPPLHGAVPLSLSRQSPRQAPM